LSTSKDSGKAAAHDALADDGAGFSLLTVIRTIMAGVLMGIANLIPGVSGGTMILAVGLYEEFIDSVADITAFRFSRQRIAFLVVLIGFAAVAIVVLSSVILYLLLWHSSLMFSLFIGLTLGGTPVLLGMIGRLSTRVVVAALAGFLLMAGIAMLQSGAAIPQNTVMDLVSGVVGSTTMVLPGISGSYMLLVLNQYDRVVGAVADLRGGAMDSIKILAPVGLGVLIGIVGLSNLLKVLLRRFEKITLGFLLGMLLGSVLGLWPFGRPPTEKLLSKCDDTRIQQYVEIHGIEGAEGLEGEVLAQHIVARWPDRTSPSYTPREVALSVVALVVGFFATVMLGRLGKEKSRLKAQASAADA
jgi:putative membrane protein